MRIIIDKNDIGEAKRISDEAVKRALKNWGQAYEDHAKTYAPVDTGRLRNSITHKPQGNNTEVVQTNVEYAIYQEMGTSKMRAQPYMRPAGENHIAEYKSIIESELKK